MVCQESKRSKEISRFDLCVFLLGLRNPNHPNAFSPLLSEFVCKPYKPASASASPISEQTREIEDLESSTVIAGFDLEKNANIFLQGLSNEYDEGGEWAVTVRMKLDNIYSYASQYRTIWWKWCDY